MKTVRPAKGKAVIAKRAGSKPAISKAPRPLSHADVPVAHRSASTARPQQARSGSGTTLYLKPKPAF